LKGEILSARRIREIGNALIAGKKLPNFHLSPPQIDQFIAETVGQKEELKVAASNPSTGSGLY